MGSSEELWVSVYLTVVFSNKMMKGLLIVLSVSVSRGGARMFHRGGQGGASNQPGVAQKYSLFQYKNVIDYIVLDCLSA